MTKDEQQARIKEVLNDTRAHLRALRTRAREIVESHIMRGDDENLQGPVAVQYLIVRALEDMNHTQSARAVLGPLTDMAMAAYTSDDGQTVSDAEDGEVVEVLPLYVVVCRVCKRLEGRHTNMEDGKCSDCDVPMTPALSLDDAVLFESDEDMENDPDPVGLTGDDK